MDHPDYTNHAKASHTCGPALRRRDTAHRLVLACRARGACLHSRDAGLYQHREPRQRTGLVPYHGVRYIRDALVLNVNVNAYAIVKNNTGTMSSSPAAKPSRLTA